MYCRSDVGARLAVESTHQVLGEFLENSQAAPSLSAIKHWAEENLPRQLVRRWRERVADHLLENPLTQDDLRRLHATEDNTKLRQVILEPALAYGATVLSVILTESFILYLQLGDGDFMTVTGTGEVSKPPLPADERLMANETTSLCSRDAWRDFRSFFQVLSGSLPALILVTTDGYGNSFQDESGFTQVGVDLLEMIRSEGLDVVQESIDGWLAEASEKGSGDDITLGLICRCDAMQLPSGRIPTENESVLEGKAAGNDQQASRSQAEHSTQALEGPSATATSDSAEEMAAEQHQVEQDTEEPEDPLSEEDSDLEELTLE
jgi:hypothetical protein